MVSSIAGDFYRLEIRFAEDFLGTVPKSKEVYKKYIASKKPDLTDDELDEEVNSVQDTEEKGWTGFHKDDNGLFIFDYMLKGFIKASFEVCQEIGAIDKVKAYRKWIDELIFIWPRKIYCGQSDPDSTLERPLRVMTMQGPRVTLSRSDTMAEGTRLRFLVEVLGKKIKWESIEQVFDYGRYVGLGQWRGSGGFGRFELEDVTPINKELGIKAKAMAKQSDEQFWQCLEQ